MAGPEDSKEASSEYVDRAQQRRNMYGTSTGGQAAVAVMTEEDATQRPSTTETKTEVIRPEEALGASNVGNKMLKKLGWNSGQSLGRRNQDDSSAKNKNETQNNLKNDWERIEAMAGSQRK